MKGPLLRALCAALVGCVGVGIVSIEGPTAIGGTLGLQPTPPDLYSGFLTTQYVTSSGSTGTLSVTGFPLTLTLAASASPLQVSNGSYDLTAQINQNTGQATSGSLEIGGTISPIASSGTLLTGTLSEFASSASSGGGIFEFLFNVTGGDLAPYYPTQVGVELTATGSTFTGSFLTSFALTANQGVADNFNFVNVPEPGTGVLCLVVLAGFVLALNRCRLRQ